MSKILKINEFLETYGIYLARQGFPLYRMTNQSCEILLYYEFYPTETIPNI